MAADVPHRPSPGRLLGLYALSVMEREGPIYGYRLALRIRERTGGAWSPGAGAVYPALASLVRRGWARPEPLRTRRRTYRITAAGRRRLERIRRAMDRRRAAGPDLAMLWAEIRGRGEPGTFLVDRFEVNVERVLDYLSSDRGAVSTRATHRRRVLACLDRAARAVRSMGPAPAATNGPRRRGVGA